MEEKLHRAGRLLLSAAILLGWSVLLVGGTRLLLPYLAPFAVAFVLAGMLRRLAGGLSRAAGIRLRPAAGLLLCFLAAAVLGTAGYLGERLLALLRLTLTRLPQLAAEGTRQLQQVLGMSAGDTALSRQVAGALSVGAEKLYSTLAGAAGNALTGLPELLVPFLFACVATVYFTLDYDRLSAGAAALLGTGRYAHLQALRTRAVSVSARLLRAYGVLFLLTAAQLWVGLSLLGVKGAASLALLIAVVDVLPVLGVGTVLLPWAVVSALSGEGALAAGLLVLYGVIWLVRQFAEPRLVGQQLGLHPLASLFFLYVGLKAGGLAGMLLTPAAATLCWQLYREKSGAASADGVQGEE